MAFLKKPDKRFIIISASFVIGLIVLALGIYLFLNYKELLFEDIILKVVITLLTYLIAFVEINDIWLEKPQKRKNILCPVCHTLNT